jgi:hypothetical protein
VLAAGCGGGGAQTDPDAISSVLRDAAAAAAKGEGDKACGHLTGDAQRQAVLQLGSAGGPGTTSCAQLVGRAQFFLTPLDKQRIKGLQATDVRVNGANASATLRGAADPNATPVVVAVNLAKVGGDWKVSGFGQAAGLPGG